MADDDYVYDEATGEWRPASEVAAAANSKPVAKDAAGNVLDYDIEAQTVGVLENLGVVLQAAGLGYEDVVDMTVYLHDMKDFARYNRIYARYFQGVPVPPARTTMQVAKLPGRNYIEVKAIAAFSRESK